MNISGFKGRMGSEGWNTIQTFLARIIAFSISLLFKISIARLLTVEENGIFGKWLATYNYGIVAFSLGLNLSMIYYSRNNKSILNNFLSNTTVYFLLLVLSILIGFLLPSKLYNFTIFIAVFFGLLISSLNSVQLSNNKITTFNLTEVSKNIFIFITCLVPLYFLDSVSLNSLYILYPGALLLTFIIFIFHINISKINFKRISLPKLDY
ncbi:hypothetical protein, partial [uncultured Salegentibacter sp.]|uniref:hypothetical protein n=1 Tax=uncultured Salegentibacter sp. TaxID=259320 RepID=UPI0030DDC349